VPVVAAPPPAPVDSSGGDRFVLRTLTASAPPAPALRQRPGADVGHLHHRAAMAAAAAWRQARTARAMPVATAVFPALLATRAATGERRARRVLGIPHWAALLAAAATLAGVGVLLLAAMPLPGLEDLDETVAPSSEVGATRR
jgi:hypothetical protein